MRNRRESGIAIELLLSIVGVWTIAFVALTFISNQSDSPGTLHTTEHRIWLANDATEKHVEEVGGPIEEPAL